jgi:dTDP-4-dehydrorhamnose 3,5-epimerase
MKSAIKDVEFFPIEKHQDSRGWLMELFRKDSLEPEHFPAMAYVSQTEPGVSRGPHLHEHQTDIFYFMGPGDFELHLWEGTVWEVPHHEVFIVGESNPVGVLVPPGVIHSYKNISDKPGWVFNAPNKLYAGPGKKYPVDEVRFENIPNHPYKM